MEFSCTFRTDTAEQCAIQSSVLVQNGIRFLLDGHIFLLTLELGDVFSGALSGL